MAHHIEKSGEIEAPIETVYQIIADVTKYPEFLPGLNEVKREGDIVEMSVNLGPTKISWKSKVVEEPNKSIAFSAIEGLFKQMDGKWEFTQEGNKTLVKYTTDFELKMAIPGINQMAAKAIAANADSTMEAFKKRVASFL